MKNILFMLILISLASGLCFGLGETWVNQEVTATGDVWLRTSPPKGLFCTKGEPIDTVKKGEKVKVLEHVKITCALFFSYDFIKIERLAEGISNEKRIGYAAVIDDKTNKPLFEAEKN